MLFVRPAREQVVAEQIMLTRDRQEMARAHNPLATGEVAREVSDGVELAGEKFERRLIKHMDKGPIGLRVADHERQEALGRSRGVIASSCALLNFSRFFRYENRGISYFDLPPRRPGVPSLRFVTSSPSTTREKCELAHTSPQ